jgi:HlyD family secretion protein
MKRMVQGIIFLGCCGLILGFNAFEEESHQSFIPTAYVIKQDLEVEIKTVGELEAARSTIIASNIKGDQGKIIDLIPDGVYVQPGQILVKMDPTPFEDKVEKLRAQLKEHEIYVASLEQALEWEKIQTDHKDRAAFYEVEAAKLELDKMKYGDGPQEENRLKGMMQKAKLKYDELNSYSQDLMELETQGFLNATEVKQAQKKLVEEEEAYELAKLQYESYIQHVYPMQIKKGETNLKRAQVNEEETAKSGVYHVAKAHALLEQAKQDLSDMSLQLLEAEKELAQTEIIAPAPGMVVHREEYRSGQRRKPRVGDSLVKNQPLLDLPDLSAMLVKTRIREVDLFKIGIGKKVTIEVDAYPQLSFKGTLCFIGVLALADFGQRNDEKYFEVRIALDESEPCLRPGMTTRTTIHAQKALGTLTIPLHAVFDEHKQNYCYVVCPNATYEKRSIKLGISNEQWVEVKEGLQEGECIFLIDPTMLSSFTLWTKSKPRR